MSGSTSETALPISAETGTEPTNTAPETVEASATTELPPSLSTENEDKKLSPLSQKLATTVAAANKQYALKKYNEASELYAQAAEIQDSINGENNPINADILYFYGRALFQCAQAKSDILGSGLGGATEEKAEKKEKDTIAKPSSNKDAAVPGKKGLFSFQGDENFDQSDEEEEDVEDAEEENAEEEDDFSLAFGILDLAKTLFVQRLESPPGDENLERQLHERLAEVYDLLGEVSLEGEAFPQAVIDLTSSLELKERLYPIDSTMIAEAHYKLSLALEFASVVKGGDEEGEAEEEEVPKMDPKEGRELSAKHMELAIESCRKRIEGEEAKMKEAEDKEKAKRSLSDAKDMVKELEQRLQELKMPLEQVAEEQQKDRQIAVNSVLASMLGGDPAMAKKMLEQAISGANDIGSVVRKKEKLEPITGASSSSSVLNGNIKKRKAEDEEEKTTKESAPTPASADLSTKKPRVTTEEEEAAEGV